MSKTITLDTITRTSLIDHGFPLHYYFRFLNWALRGLKQATYDHPINIKSVRRTITSYGAIVVPDDCIGVGGIVHVGLEESDKVVPLVHDPSLNRLNKFDSGGNKVLYSAGDENYYPGIYEDNFNSNGEHKGRDFAYVGDKRYSYKYIEERNEIQLGIGLTGCTEAVLTYITDGVTISEVNVVHPYAEELILSWIRWKRLEHLPRLHRNETAESKARSEYYNNKRIFRGRLEELTVNDIIMAGRRGHHAGLKE